MGWGAVIPLSTTFLLSLDSFTLEESCFFFLDQFCPFNENARQCFLSVFC